VKKEQTDMDWTKAKSVLLTAFLILNIFLLSSIIINRLDNKVSTETISNTKEILESNGVVFKTRIPNRIANDIQLQYKPNQLPADTILRGLLGNTFSYSHIELDKEYVVDNKSLTFPDETSFVYKNTDLGENITATSKKDLEKYARGWISKLGLQGKQLKLDRFHADTANGTYVLVFRESYEKFLLYDNCIEMEITAKGMSSVEARLKKLDSLKQRDRKIVPAHAILLNNFPSGSKAVITDIDLGFKGYMENQETTRMYEYLVWRIRLENGEESFFKASDGIRIK
jgi:regulatory protein YycI of two-component signal transduction system YycFG